MRGINSQNFRLRRFIGIILNLLKALSAKGTGLLEVPILKIFACGALFLHFQNTCCISSKLSQLKELAY